MSNKYKAFISYSHKDSQWGEWLHKQLEKYSIFEKHREKVGGSKTFYPIFRDRAELPSSSSLNDLILNALQNSDYMIVISSPNSTKSKYVNEEIRRFKKLYGEEKVLALIVDGEPNATTNDKFDNDLEAFPKALRYEVGVDGELDEEKVTEPIAADAREIGDDKERALIKIIAGLLGVGFEELWQREKRRKRRNTIFLSILIVTIFSIISGLAYFSYLKKLDADEQRDEVQNRLYNSLMEQGFIAKDHLDLPLKAKHYFAKAAKESMTQLEEKNARAAMNNINRVKLQSFFNLDQNISKKYNNGSFVHLDKRSQLKLLYLNINKENSILSSDASKTLLWNNENVYVISTLNQDELYRIQHNGKVVKAIFDKNATKVLSISQNEKSKQIVLTDIKNKKEIFRKNYNNSRYCDTCFIAVLSEDEKSILVNNSNSNIVEFIDSETGEKKSKIIDLELIQNRADSEASLLKDIKLINNSLILLFKGDTHDLSVLYAYNINNHNTKILIVGCNNHRIFFKNNELFSIQNCNETDASINSWDFNEGISNYLHMSNKNYELEEEIIDINYQDMLLAYTANRALIWDKDNLFELYHKDIKDAFFLKDKTKIATVGKDKTVKHWTIEKDIVKSGEDNSSRTKNDKFEEIDVLTKYENYKFNNNKTWILYSRVNDHTQQQTVDLYDIINQKAILSFSHQINFKEFLKLSFDENESYISSVAVTSDYDGYQNYEVEVIVWNIPDNKQEFRHVFKGIRAIEFTKDPTKIFIVTNSSAALWDTKKNKEVFNFLYLYDYNVYNNIKFSKDNMFLFMSGCGDEGCMNGEVQVRNFLTGKSLLNIRLDAPPGHSVGFCNDDKWILVMNDDYTEIWDIESRKKILSLVHEVGSYNANFIENNQAIVWTTTQELNEEKEKEWYYNLLKNRNLPKKYLPLEIASEAGMVLDERGNINVLSLKKWQIKKAEYDKIYKQYNP